MANYTEAYRRDRVINGGTKYVGRDSEIISYIQPQVELFCQSIHLRDNVDHYTWYASAKLLSLDHSPPRFFDRMKVPFFSLNLNL